MKATAFDTVISMLPSSDTPVRPIEVVVVVGMPLLVVVVLPPPATVVEVIVVVVGVVLVANEVDVVLAKPVYVVLELVYVVVLV